MGVLTSAMQSGYEIGRSTGSSGIGRALTKIADKLKATRETEEGIGVLGRTERIKAQVKQEYEPTAEYRPTTQEEALKFEGAKAGLKTKLPEGYEESLSNAVAAVEAGQDPNMVFRKMAATFPNQSTDLKRILVPSTKLGELDISEALWGK